MASTDARPFPIKNTAYRVTFPILDADGDLVTGAASLDSEVSKDGGTFADCTNEATEIATSSGMYYLDLTSTEMNADTVAVIVKTSTSGAKTTPIVLYPVEAGDIDVDVTAWNGTAIPGVDTAGYPKVTVKDGTGTGELDTASGRVIADVTYWNGSAVASPDTAGYPKVTIKDGTGTGEIDTTSGRVIANVTYWNGTAVATPDTAGYPKVTIKDGTGTGEIDLNSGAVGANVTQIGGSTTAASAAAKAYQGIIYGTFVTGTLSATSSSTDLTGYGNDTFNGRTLTVITGDRAGEQATISDHVETNGVLTYSALTGAPSNGDEFFIA